jgi:predicted house-cleaning NTP pyrophosphatase (Maf/HAM1 superfamily)
MKKLAQEMRFTFECHTSDYPEDMRVYKQSWRLAEHLALGKAQHVAEKFPDSIIIGAFYTCGQRKKSVNQLRSKMRSELSDL